MEIIRHRRVRSTLDLAPLIDVVFLLLIFFLLASNFVPVRAMDLALPQSEVAVPVNEPSLVITMHRDGTIRVEGEVVGLGDLTEHLRPLLASQPPRPVSLQTDRSLPVQQVVTLMDHIHQAGGQRVLLTTTGR